MPKSERQERQDKAASKDFFLDSKRSHRRYGSEDLTEDLDKLFRRLQNVDESTLPEEAESKRKTAYFQAVKAELDSKRLVLDTLRAAGVLAEKGEIEKAWAAKIKSLRSFAQNLPSQLKQQCPDIQPVVLEKLDELIRKNWDEVMTNTRAQ